jgi:hypothetical protein
MKILATAIFVLALAVVAVGAALVSTASNAKTGEDQGSRRNTRSLQREVALSPVGVHPEDTRWRSPIAETYLGAGLSQLLHWRDTLSRLPSFSSQIGGFLFDDESEDVGFVAVPLSEWPAFPDSDKPSIPA